MNLDAVKKVLFILPSNLGDIILSFWSFDMVKEALPQAEIDCVVSPHTKEFIKKANIVSGVIVYRKDWHWRQKAKFALSLRHKYDLVIDFKNTALPFFTGVSLRTPLFRQHLDQGHKRDFYLRLSLAVLGRKKIPQKRHLDFELSAEEKGKWDKLLQPAIFIAPASRNFLKMYPASSYRRLAESLSRQNTLVLVGSAADKKIGLEIVGKNAQANIINLIGRTSLAELFYLLRKYAICLVASDSAPLHLASYLNIPVVAIFGPTSFKKYGPTSAGSVILINRKLKCLGCNASHCDFDLACMREIEPEEVEEAVRKIINSHARAHLGN